MKLLSLQDDELQSICADCGASETRKGQRNAQLAIIQKFMHADREAEHEAIGRDNEISTAPSALHDHEPTLEKSDARSRRWQLEQLAETLFDDDLRQRLISAGKPTSKTCDEQTASMSSSVGSSTGNQHIGGMDVKGSAKSAELQSVVQERHRHPSSASSVDGLPSTSANLDRRDQILESSKLRNNIIDVVVDIQEITHCLTEARGRDLVSIEGRGRLGSADFIVLVTGASKPHILALIEATKYQIQEKLRALTANCSEKDPVRTEVLASLKRFPATVGTPASEWIALDAGKVLVHAFTDSAREYYNIEGMWADMGTTLTLRPPDTRGGAAVTA